MAKVILDDIHSMKVYSDITAFCDKLGINTSSYRGICACSSCGSKSLQLTIDDLTHSECVICDICKHKNEFTISFGNHECYGTNDLHFDLARNCISGYDGDNGVVMTVRGKRYFSDRFNYLTIEHVQTHTFHRFMCKVKVDDLGHVEHEDGHRDTYGERDWRTVYYYGRYYNAIDCLMQFIDDVECGAEICITRDGNFFKFMSPCFDISVPEWTHDGNKYVNRIDRFKVFLLEELRNLINKKNIIFSVDTNIITEPIQKEIIKQTKHKGQCDYRQDGLSIGTLYYTEVTTTYRYLYSDGIYSIVTESRNEDEKIIERY